MTGRRTPRVPDTPPTARWGVWTGSLALAAFVAGSAAQLQEPVLRPAAVYGALLLFASAVGCWFAIKRGISGRLWTLPRGALAALALVALLAAGYGQAGLRAWALQRQALPAALEGQRLLLTGMVASLPVQQPQGLRFVFEVAEARTPEGEPVRVPARVMLSWWGGPQRGGREPPRRPDVRAGEVWRFTVALKAPHGSRNPHGFDAELWLWEQGIRATGTVRTARRDAPPQRLDATWRHPVERARQAVREAIFARLAGPADAEAAPDGEGLVEPMTRERAGQGGPAAAASTDAISPATGDAMDGTTGDTRADAAAAQPATDPASPSASNAASATAPTAAADAARRRARLAGVVAALVTGDQSAIERADWDMFRATGTAHLVAISGLHITLLAWVARALVGAAWRRSARLCLAVPAPTAGLLGGLAVATAYAVFAGWGLPAQRTVLMLAVVLGLRLSGRDWPWPTVWLAALAAVVAADPWALLQAGFWLSFVAVGILFATNLKADEDQTALGYRAVFSKFLSLARTQGVLTLALAPLTLLLFGQVSVVGLLANLLAVPWVTLVVTPLALGGLMLPPLWTAAAWALEPLSALLGALAALPWATASVPAAPWWVGAVGVAGGLLLALRLPWVLRALGLPLLLPALLWPAQRPAPGSFELLAADIGQGTAVLVRTAGHTLLYDAGPRFSAESDAGERVLVPLLRALGERVDTVLLSHRDSDHIGGARAVLAAQPQAALLSSIEDGHALQALRPVTRCAAGQRWRWDGVQFELLHPLAQDYAQPRKSNAMSCVLQVQDARGRRALLVGDIEAAQEAELIARATAAAPGNAQAEGASLRSEVLLLPHHGSQTSSSAAFLDAVAPRWALIQAGYLNRYGHPAPAVLARLRERGVAVVDTVRCGAARWSSAEAGAPRCERAHAPHYWQHQVPPRDVPGAGAQLAYPPAGESYAEIR